MEQENELLKMAFKDNDYLLKLTRNVFFGFPVTDEEKRIVKETYGNAALKEIVRKKFYPLFGDEMPIGSVSDFWGGTEQNLLGQHRDTIYQNVISKQEVMEMLQRGFEALTDYRKIDLNYNPKLSVNDDLAVKLLARNLYIRTVETGLNFIKLVANQKEEDKKETAKKLLKNSNK